MAANDLSERMDPADPVSVARWTTEAAMALREIRGDLGEIKAKQAANADWRLSVENRLVGVAQTVASHDTAIDDLRCELQDLPDRVRDALQARPANPGPHAGADKGVVTFRWLLERVALPLLLSGAGTGIVIVLALKSVGLLR